MSEEPPDLTTLWADHRALVVYVAVLGVLAIGASITALLRWQKQGTQPWPGVSPWTIKPLDFSLFIVGLVLWFGVSALVVFEAGKAILGEEAAAESMGLNIFAGALMQLGMLGFFLLVREQARTLEEKRLSRERLSFIHSVGWGLWAWLAMLPAVYGLMIVWTAFLTVLQNMGVQIDLEPQDAVQIFQQIENPLWLAAMIALAVIVAPICEEFVFRGGLYRYLRARMTVPVAMLFSSLAFGLIHFTILGFPSLTLVGIACCLAYEATGNLKVPIFLHAFFNLNQVILMLLSGTIFAGG